MRHWLTKRSWNGVITAGAFLSLSSIGLVAWIAPNRSASQRDSSNPQVTLPPTGWKEESVHTLTVSTQRLNQFVPESRAVEYTGIVTPHRISRLSARSLALVERVHVDLGDAISKGQVLVELEHDQLKARRALAEAEFARGRSVLEELVQGPRKQEIEQARARLRELAALLALRQSNLQRIDRLRTTQSVSQQELDEARAAFDAAQAQLQGSEQALQLLEEGSRREQVEAQRAVVQSLEASLALIQVQIRESLIVAPFDGLVQNRLVDEGTVVAPGEVILEVLESDHWEIVVGLPERAWMQNSSEAWLKVGSEKKPLEFVRQAPQIDAKSRTREVVFRLSPQSLTAQTPLLAGQAVTVVLHSTIETEGWWVPTSALAVAERGLWGLLIVVPNQNSDLATVERKQVELLGTVDQWSRVQGPLRGDELVIVDGLHRLAPGQLVQYSVAAR